MIQKTSDHTIFKLRSDNRARVDQGHVKRLVQSIQSKNMLELRPIIVNQDMEVLDGQHRLLAAKQLNCEIYYTIQQELDSYDIIRMNVAKSWLIKDFLNYYVKNGYKEYQKLEQFMKDNRLTLKVALKLCYGLSREDVENFKQGKFILKLEDFQNEFDQIWEVIDLIKKLNGAYPSLYTQSVRFWSAIIQIMRHPNFNYGKFLSNIAKFNHKLTAKATMSQYINLLVEIHNWHNKVTINLDDMSDKLEVA